MSRFALCTLLFAAICSAAAAEDKHTLRYKFEKGQTLYWTVSHKAHIRSTVMGTTKQAETESDSLKVWKVEDIDSKGRATFVHSVESVRMKHQVSGREAGVFDSESGEEPSLEFRDVAADIGVPLNRVTIDTMGEVIEKKELRKKPKESTSGYEGPMTIPLPGEPIAVGGEWKMTHLVRVPRSEGGVQSVKVQQTFTLKSVKDGVAEIYMESAVLTPVHDPQVKAQLIQSKTKGTARFDIAAGRVIEQDLSLEEEIVGAPAGPTSSMQYAMRFLEKFYADRPKLAQRARDDAKNK